MGLRIRITTDLKDEDLILEEIQVAITKAREQTEKPSLVVIEGFLIYSFPSIVSQLDISIYVTIDKATCCERRKANPQYFEEVLWPSYITENEPLLEDLDRLFVVDGALPKRDVVADVICYLRGKDVLSKGYLLKQNLC